MRWINPIFDRAISDIQLKTSKAYMNTADLNRVESDCEYLASVLGVAIQTKRWVDNEFVYASDVQRIINNVQAIRERYAVYPYTPSVPAMPVNTYTKWNDIEENLFAVHELYELSFELAPQAGEVYSGEVNNV